ncbi:MAG TPA: hypothetical protein VIJ96_04605 [Acidothermaceae bacterium]
MKLSHIPPRLAAGAFILNTGIGKLSADDEAASRLHGMAAGTYPFLAKIDPPKFVRALAIGEIGVGTVLLAPVVPAWLAGAVLTGFSGSLLRMYLKTPGMTKEDGIRPTQQGTAVSKDVWMLGSGLELFFDDIGDRRRKARKAKRRAARLHGAHAA